LLVVCEGNKGVYCMVTAMTVSETVDCGNAEAQHAVFLYEKKWKSSEESIWKAATASQSDLSRSGDCGSGRKRAAKAMASDEFLDAWMGSRFEGVGRLGRQ
jgi:hypothetical protein